MTGRPHLAGLAGRLVATLALACAGVVVALPASATTPIARGWIYRAVQVDHSVRVAGWALDTAQPTSEVTVRLLIDGHNMGTQPTDHFDPLSSKVWHLTGDHGFVFDVNYAYWGRTAAVYIVQPAWRLPLRTVVREYTPGERIIMLARRYVGYPYVWDGASPSGFDCSGYTMYIYAHAHVATLVHNAEAQLRETRRISGAVARPGDLIFYLSEGYAYHVAIFAGHGMQYAAADPAEGVVYQAIFSSAISFGTTWH